MSKEKRPGRGKSIHNPFPASMASECEKASLILDSLINPRYIKLDVGIPHKILAEAKGLVILTSLRVGFLGSGRLGSGLIVARLPDGRWSAPCALMTGGAGVGGLVGLELTDFVFVLTSDEAVNALATFGSLTLGLNVSMAAGPMGRSAEATGTASRKGVASMLSYSKTRGLYGGVSLEGGVLLERADANKKIYGRKVTAKELLCGDITPPPETASLMRILNSPCFSSEPAAVSPAEATTDGRPNNIQTESVALPSQTPNLPPSRTHELNGQTAPQIAELDTGPPCDTLELSGDNLQDRPLELESTVSLFISATSANYWRYLAAAIHSS
ncbi:hypothetical protein N7509_013042 [Penicillium cosmopolitanum]|uniref:Ysc84 actin-binding domain-containing protein n=1 Tax=Penicillium cosmopolitanum TaxID=1131564 RepID=A0A9W9SCI1_9EURO|nr:uncharacterized protein N7509_013042 [Penicillium cosmopolitanum]KAJ5376156.1 hypothetical protein N7509_013042 [Penicillium cosmopolitanum]